MSMSNAIMQLKFKYYNFAKLQKWEREKATKAIVFF